MFKFDPEKPARVVIDKGEIVDRRGARPRKDVRVIEANRLSPFKVVAWSPDHRPVELDLSDDAKAKGWSVLSFEQD